MPIQRRGPQYDMDKIIELYDSGKKIKGIAEELHISSLQSLRHAVERELRKRKVRESEEMRIREKQETFRVREDDKRKKEEKKAFIKRIGARNMGLFRYFSDEKTMGALNCIINELSEPSIIIDEKKREILIKETVNIQTIQETLYEWGFTAYISTDKNKLKPCSVKIMHDHFDSKIGTEIMAQNLFIFLRTKDGEDRIKLALKDLISMGLIKYNDCNNLKVDDTLDVDYVSGITYSKGCYAKIIYDPVYTMKTMGMKVLGIISPNKILIIDDLTRNHIKNFVESKLEVIFDAWKLSMIKQFFDLEITLDELIDAKVDPIVKELQNELHCTELFVYAPYLEKIHLNEINEEDFLEEMKSFVRDTIRNSYMKGPVNLISAQTMEFERLICQSYTNA